LKQENANEQKLHI